MLWASIFFIVFRFIIVRSISIKLFYFNMFSCQVNSETVFPIAFKITEIASKDFWSSFSFIPLILITCRYFSGFVSYLVFPFIYNIIVWWITNLLSMCSNNLSSCPSYLSPFLSSMVGRSSVRLCSLGSWGMKGRRDVLQSPYNYT